MGMRQAQTRGATGREYLRVSVDRSGRARSVEEQHRENLRDADDLGATLGEPYIDNSRSASRYASKARDDFERLMDDLRSGEFGADLLWLWESSRGSRRVGEWVDLIDLCERRGVHIRVTVHGRTYDPSNHRDRRSLLEDAVDSEYESGKVSTRARRAAAASAADGRPHGVPPYGYRRVYDERTGRLIGQEVDPDEATVIRELFERITAGHSLAAIEREFNTRGFEKRSGGPFSKEQLRDMALQPAYAGLRVHIPGQRLSKGARAKSMFSDDATISPGEWEPIVPKADYFAVREKLTDPARLTARPGRGVHLLSMIARCGTCDSKISAYYPWVQGEKQRTYKCQRNNCVRIDADDLDQLAVRLMVDYLSNDSVLAEIAATADADGEHASTLAKIQGEIAEIRASLDELADAVAAGSVSVNLAARSEPRLRERLILAEQRERQLSTPSALHFLIGRSVDIATTLKSEPMSARREVARMLFAPDLLGTLLLHRRPVGRRGGKVPAVDRFELRRSTS